MKSHAEISKNTWIYPKEASREPISPNRQQKVFNFFHYFHLFALKRIPKMFFNKKRRNLTQKQSHKIKTVFV